MNSAFVVLLKNTWQKELRSRMFVGFLIIGIIFLFLTHQILTLIESDTNSQMLLAAFNGSEYKLFYFMICGYTSLLAFIMGINLLRSDLDTKVIGQILSFPLSRTKYIFIRLVSGLSLILTLYLFFLLMGSFIFGFTQFDLSFLLTLLLNMAFLTTMMIMSCVFSFFMPKIVCYLATWFLVTINTVVTVQSSVSGFSFSELSISKIFGGIVYFIVPRFYIIMQWQTKLLFGDSFDPSLWPHILQFFLCSAVWFLGLIFYFQRREF